MRYILSFLFISVFSLIYAQSHIIYSYGYSILDKYENYYHYGFDTKELETRGSSQDFKLGTRFSDYGFPLTLEVGGELSTIQYKAWDYNAYGRLGYQPFGKVFEFFIGTSYGVGNDNGVKSIFVEDTYYKEAYEITTDKDYYKNTMEYGVYFMFSKNSALELSIKDVLKMYNHGYYNYTKSYYYEQKETYDDIFWNFSFRFYF